MPIEPRHPDWKAGGKVIDTARCRMPAPLNDQTVMREAEFAASCVVRDLAKGHGSVLVDEGFGPVWLEARGVLRRMRIKGRTLEVPRKWGTWVGFFTGVDDAPIQELEFIALNADGVNRPFAWKDGNGGQR